MSSDSRTKESDGEERRKRKKKRELGKKINEPREVNKRRLEHNEGGGVFTWQLSRTGSSSFESVS